MKSIKYIVVVGLLAVFSCKKENIKPSSVQCGDRLNEINKSFIFSNVSPESEDIIKDVVLRGTGKNDSGGPIVTDSVGIEVLPGDITDPNNEPDVSKRKGKK